MTSQPSEQCPKCGQYYLQIGQKHVCRQKPSGKKYDISDKLRFDLIPPIALKALAAVLTIDANKYGPNNWQDLDDFEDRFTGALMRHLNAWRSGEKDDPESKLPHLWHILCNVAFLVWDEAKDPEK